MQKNILDKLPEDFVPRQQWPEYDLPSTFPSFLNPRLIDKDPRGVRWGFWPFCFEEYTTDKEPDVSAPSSGLFYKRIVIWFRLTRTDTPQGWRAISKKRSRLEGVAFISKDDKYADSWSRVARYDRHTWQEDFLNTEYRIEKVSPLEFRDAYNKSTVARKVRDETIDIVDRVTKGPKRDHVELWCARNIKKGDFVAGMATITSQTRRASYYLCGFMHEITGSAPVMTGLIDNWFSHSQKNGVRYMHLGDFWNRGRPESWKGFSNFKAKFITHYLFHTPPILFRFAY